VQPCGDQGIELAKSRGRRNRLRIDRAGEARGLAQGLGFQRDKEAGRVDAAIEPAIERMAGCGEVERCRDAGRAPDQRAGHFARFAQPLEQRVAAERDADGVYRRVGVLRFDVTQDALDILAVASEVGARQPVVLARATPEMRHHPMPAACLGADHEIACVMAVGTAFEAMEQHHDGLAGMAVHPVEIEKIAVRQFQPFAPVSDRRHADEQAAVNGL